MSEATNNPNTPAANAGVVIVGCKLPHGLHLDLKTKSGESQRISLNGANTSRIVGGYGLTRNVPTEFITEWLKRNAKHPAVINNEIFVHTDMESAEAKAKEQREIKTGFEAIDPMSNGMLENENGELDRAAVKAYEAQRQKNPVRDQQIQE